MSYTKNQDKKADFSLTEVRSMELSTFSFANKKVRVLQVGNGNSVFIANDVVAILSLGNVTEALRSLDNDELTSVKMKSGGQNRNFQALTESGLYSLIFKSRKKEAKVFRKWVTSEVLPSIRKHGYYIPEKAATTGIFAGLDMVLHNGKRYFLYTAILKAIGFSTRSGTVYMRTRLYADAFIRKFGRLLISEEYAQYLSQQKHRIQKGIQLLLPFNQYVAEKGGVA